MWTGMRDMKGYGRIKIEGRMELAHRVAWRLTNGTIRPDKPCVCHRCDVPPCVNPTHLFLDTQPGNIADMINKGRYKPVCGEHQGLARLRKHEVLEIRRRHAAGEPYRALAAAFGVAVPTVSHVVRRRTWQHL